MSEQPKFNSDCPMCGGQGLLRTDGKPLEPMNIYELARDHRGCGFCAEGYKAIRRILELKADLAIPVLSRYGSPIVSQTWCNL